ncbi:MAG: 3-deoxy-manno-octulosonate cytidylyltransferase [Candidatus Zixiibacteriota bacterium]
MGRVVAVIPARLGSSRFARKVLHEYRGRPLLFYVWRQVAKAQLIDRLCIATDSREIARAASWFGAEVVMTSRKPRTGSDRVAEAVTGGRESIIINVQADCFGLQPARLDRVVKAMQQDRTIEYATLVRPIRDDRELSNPNVVKVVVDSGGRALWFSRFPLPYLQKPDLRPRAAQFGYLAHIGVYFFRRSALAKFAGWRQSRCEKAESLEQLRIIENGGTIRVFKTMARTFSIDTPRDLLKHRYEITTG